MHGIREGKGNFNDVALGATPFVVAMIGMIAILLLYPQVALWLPRQFY